MSRWRNMREGDAQIGFGRKGQRLPELSWVIDMVYIEHDEARGNGLGVFALVVDEALRVGRDEGQLSFEGSEFLGVFAVKELDLVADGLDLFGAHDGEQLCHRARSCLLACDGLLYAETGYHAASPPFRTVMVCSLFPKAWRMASRISGWW